MLYHITNRHEWEDSKLFKQCQHHELSHDEVIRKPWLKLESPAYSVMERIVTDKNLLSDLKYLTNFNHTGTLEVYHSLYNKYCPKRLHFPYSSMIARSQIAVMDFNAGVQQLENQGEHRYKQQFSKVTQTWVLKKITPRKERIYLDDLMKETIYLKQSNEKFSLPKTDGIPKNIAPIEKPPKTEAMQSIRTRFL